jgi:4-diphosphocytidyl-2-C-methyl-D-erythritol kinase
MNLDEHAPLKINLFLHVTGRRADGYHLLQSLFVFADFGDQIHYTPSDAPLSLEIVGPFAPQLATDPGNLVLRAAAMLRSAATGRLVLDKQVPVASGLGGGSADAAATLRLLNRAWQCGHDDDALRTLGAQLGADVPACIASAPCFVSGIGDALYPTEQGGGLHLVLANPGIATSTPSVFKAYKDLDSPFAPSLAHWPAPSQNWTECSNDLTAAAIHTTPEINVILQYFKEFSGANYVRMSGSGASCFAIFASAAAANQAAKAARLRHPNWWVQVAKTTGPI